MKKKILIFMSFIALILILPYVIIGIKGHINKDILSNLEGEIYYTKRVSSVLTLFKSDANLDNEALLYSHKGNGEDREGGYNDNIIDFYYDSNNKIITFIAMDDDWSVFSVKEGEDKPTLMGETREVLKDGVSLDKTRYISNKQNDIAAFSKKGSIYIVENGKEKCVKKFYGIYDDKFTGYGPIGFSPDGKYLIYSSSEHMTPLGFIVNNMVTDFSGNVYILDLETEKSSRFIKSYDIQWIMD